MRRPSSNSWIFHSIRLVLPPLLFFLLILGIWQGAVIWFDLPVYLLPGPGRVVVEAAADFSTIADATRRTAAAAVCGFLASLLVGTLVGFIFSQSAMIRSSCYPYAIFLQTVPIVAFIISLFPIITNATTGMLAVVGAIVGEFFVGAGVDRFGLGFLIRQKLEQLRTAELFAAVIASTVLGVAIFATVSLTGSKVLTRWYQPSVTNDL